MAVTDAWASWTTTAATNSPAGTATPEIDDEIRNIKAQCKTNLMALGDVQTVTAAKTFNTGTLKVESTAAGFLMNTTAGVVTYGNPASELPTGIDATKIADGTVSNTEFQYLNGVTSNIQTQLTAKSPASQADQEGLTEATKYVAPATQQFHPSAAKAWCKFSGDGTLAQSYNIASVTRTAEGKYTVAFATDFSAVGSIVIATAEHTVACVIHITAVAAASSTLEARGLGGGLIDPGHVMLAAFGDQ